jgi:hypothetical protein
VELTPENLTVAALVTWTITAMLGTNLLVRGGAYRLWRALLPGRAPLYRRRPPAGRAILIALHIVLAICGLSLWVLYVFVDRDELIYIGIGLLLIVSVIGLSVVDRWRYAPGRHSHAAHANSQFPIWSATAHAMAGTATVVLVILTLLADLH